jgi:SAM-dependent methyltransferase
MTANTVLSRLESLLPLLSCPGCRGTLRIAGPSLACGACGNRYPLHAGRPVFLPGGDPPKVMLPEHISNQPPSMIQDWMTWFDGWILNIGAGGTLVKLENVVEVEYSVFRHTDIVSDAHRLPFADASFEAVVSFNTFEHLYDPERAASEIYRVLKPGGRLVLHTAFLQPVHEPPHHYYNATEYGLRRWFRAFDIEGVTVSENFHPGHVIGWLTSELLKAVEESEGAAARKRLAASTLDFWRSTWEAPEGRKHPLWDLLRRLPQEYQSHLAAGFQLDARKPEAVDPRAVRSHGRAIAGAPPSRPIRHDGTIGAPPQPPATTPGQRP